MQTPFKENLILSITARSFVYRFLAQVYEYPQQQAWDWMCRPEVCALFGFAVKQSFGDPELRALMEDFVGKLRPHELDFFLSDYHIAFGHTARGSCPLNEIEYGDLKADPLFQPHRLADLAAFYRAFGLELTENAGERQDHFSIECEFMSVLAAKEAYALGQDTENELIQLCRDAQCKFLKEHLGRWSPSFTNRLTRALGEGVLGTIAQLTHRFIVLDCASHNVQPGSEDLLLRSIDEAEEAMCASCGIHSLPPGAMGPPVQESP